MTRQNQVFLEAANERESRFIEVSQRGQVCPPVVSCSHNIFCPTINMADSKDNIQPLSWKKVPIESKPLFTPPLEFIAGRK